MAIRFSSKAGTIVGAPSPKSSMKSNFLCETSVSLDLPIGHALTSTGESIKVN